MKQQYYVVWVGRAPGVYDNWPETEAQVKGYPAPRYKGGFATRMEAEAAYKAGHEKYFSDKRKRKKGGPSLF